MTTSVQFHSLGDPNQDLKVLQELTSRLWNPGGGWHIGELCWNRFQHLGRESEWRTAWWTVDGKPVMWGWISLPDELDLQVDPQYGHLVDEIIDWFEGHIGGTPGNVVIRDNEAHIIERLTARGYQQLNEPGPFMIHLDRDMTQLPEPQLPDGYRLRPVQSKRDAETRSAAHRAAFSLPGYPPSRVSADSYRNLMEQFPYRPELDWIVEDHDGDAVAFCLVWLDEANQAVCLEPVGCHPEHRRRGLARAASLSALHAAAELGATHAHVCARGDDDHPNARSLYQSLGFTAHGTDLTFVRQ